MILDHINHSAKYASMHPGFARALEMLRSGEVTEYPAGRHELDGERLVLIIQPIEGRTREGAKLEVHRQFIDIQVCLAGNEVIGYMPHDACQQPEGEFNEKDDYLLFTDQPTTWLELPPNNFAIFWPEDAHAPLAGVGPVQKAVFKVAVNW
jgi:YhcH/YjgK/YiaL family protein